MSATLIYQRLKCNVNAGYQLTKDEIAELLPILTRAIPLDPVVDTDNDGDDPESGPIIREVVRCPVCGRSYTFSMPNYCSRCGQAINN